MKARAACLRWPFVNPIKENWESWFSPNWRISRDKSTPFSHSREPTFIQFYTEIRAEEWVNKRSVFKPPRYKKKSLYMLRAKVRPLFFQLPTLYFFFCNLTLYLLHISSRSVSELETLNFNPPRCVFDARVELWDKNLTVLILFYSIKRYALTTKLQ